MDLKKFLDQTVREVKREVNKKVLKVPEIEQKVYEATSNEPWGPHGTLMGDIAQATRNFNEYQMIMGILWKRLNDVGKNWRHVYKSLTVLEFLVANGAERIIDELREHSYQVQTLCDFQYIEAGGKDQGVNVRKKAQSLVALLSDKEKIREVRAKAAANRDKYRGVSSTGSFSKSGSYSSTGGGYGGDSYNDDDRYGGSTRGGRDDDRYGDRDRDRDDRYRDDRYRDDDRSTRDSTGDRYRDDRDRDRFEDDRYGSSKGGDGYSNDKYGDDSKNEGSASGYGRDRDRDRSFEEDERYPPRRANGSGSGTKADDYAQDDREPSGLAAAVARAHTSQSNLSQTSSNASQGTEKKPENRLHTASSVGGSYFASNPAADDLDDFDPRGSFSASSAAPRDEDSFGTASPAAVPANTPAPLSVPAPFLPPVKSTSGIEDLFGDTGFETSFAVPAPAPVSNTTVQGNGLQSEDLFGSPAFAAVHPSTTSFPAPAPAPLPSLAPRANSVPNGNFQAFGPASTDEHNSSFGTSFSAVPPAINSTSISPQTSFLPPPPPTSSYSSTNSFQIPSGSAQAPNFPSYTSGSSSQVPFGQQAPLGGTTYGQSASTTSLLSSQVPPNNNTYAPPPPKPQQKSFQTKSGIWNDTISAGLVDLNISGPKTNPLAELGIDLKDSIFSAQEMRKKEEKILPTASNMGRAMGSGTGLGLAGAGGIAPPPVQPAMAGMNMGMGMGMRQPGMGMGMGVNPGFGVPGAPPNLGYGPGPGMGINPGFGISPGMGMAPGMGMNPGMAGYGPGMGTVQGGYTPGVGLGGYPNQQYVPSGVRDLPAEVGVQMSDFGRSAPNLPVLASGVRDRLADVGSQVSDLGRRAPNLPAVTFCVKDRVADVGAQVSDLGRRAPNLPAVAFGVRDRVTDVGAQSSDLGLSARRSVDGLTSEHTEGKIPNLKNFEVDVKYLVTFGVKERGANMRGQIYDLGRSAQHSTDRLMNEETDVADETNPRDRVSDMGAQISGLGHRARRSTDGFTNEDNEGKIPKPQEFPS